MEPQTAPPESGAPAPWATVGSALVPGASAPSP